MFQRQLYRTDILFLIFLLMQIGFWFVAKQYKPDLAIVPPVPSTLSVKALSFGDEQFYFRTLAFQLQNAGDTFGRFTALKNYDYNKLYAWFVLLDTLDNRSHFVPSLAGYYYSQTQNTPDVRYVVDYLEQTAKGDIGRKWWWLGQAVYLANHKLKDKDLALKLAYELANGYEEAQAWQDKIGSGKKIPLWVKQMPAFILEQKGEKEQAFVIIKDIIDNMDNLDQGELNFMQYFIVDRLQKMAEDNPELKKLLEKNKGQ